MVAKRSEGAAKEEREKMTNAEFLVLALRGEHDDDAVNEAEIYYHVACPYYESDQRALCFGELTPQRKLCEDCKRKWLESEIDK